MGNPIGHAVLLIFAVFSLKFSEQVAYDEYQNILVDIEADHDDILAAFQAGNMTAINKFKDERVLEKYINAYVYEKAEDMRADLHRKIRLLNDLLSEKIISVPPEQFTKEHPEHGGLFNVSFVPKTSFVITFLVNITTVKMMETLPTGRLFPLIMLCSLPDVEPRTIKYLLDNGADVNARTSTHSPRNATAVFAATETGNLQVLKLLVENGAIVDITFRSPVNRSFSGSSPTFIKLFYKKEFQERPQEFVDVSPLTVATFGTNIDVFRFLLPKTKNLTKENDSWLILYKPVLTWNSEMTEALLRLGADPNDKDVVGSTAVHRAALFGNYKITRQLLENNGDVNATDDFGWTPLHVAALFSLDCNQLIRLFLEYGSDVNAVTDGGFSPLNLVEAGRDLEFVIYLEKTVPLDRNTKHNRQPVAAEKGHVEVVTLLLDSGARVNHQDDILGWSTLHWASAIGDLEVVKTLIDKYGANVNLKSKMGMTPSETAEYFGMTNVAEYFKEKGSLRRS